MGGVARSDQEEKEGYKKKTLVFFSQTMIMPAKEQRRLDMCQTWSLGREFSI